MKTMSEKIAIEPATEADLDELSQMLGELFAQESDFRPDKDKQHQAHGYGSKLLQHAIDFAKQKNFLRITLLTDRPENLAQEFFRRHGFVESSMIPMRLLITPESEQTQPKP